MAEEEVIRHNLKIRQDVHPTLYEELSKTRNDRASIQRLLALATLGLMAERVGMRPMEFHHGQMLRIEPHQNAASEIPTLPMQKENPVQASPNMALDFMNNTFDMDDLHDVFEEAKS